MKTLKFRDLRIFDNGGKTLDRYTIIPPRWHHREYKDRDGYWNCISSCASGSGVFMWVGCSVGNHLGVRVSPASLPPQLISRVKRAFEIAE